MHFCGHPRCTVFECPQITQIDADDDSGRRTSVENSGTAFAATAFNLWGYNPKSELEASRRYTGSYDPDPPSQDEITAERRLYTYDQIGNRQHVTVGNYTAPTLRYCADDLNRYNQTYTGSLQTCPVASPAESFAYDDDGNLTQDGAFNYTWDAENRLVGMHTGDLNSPQTNDKWLEFKYDYMGRRVEKTYKIYCGGWQVQSGYPIRFVYDGWNPVLVLKSDNTPKYKLTWGLDLSGTTHGAGGIGGLLACEEPAGASSNTYWFFYDGNGNVGQLVKTIKDGQGNITGVESTLAAHYEYDPYGNLINSSGPYKDANPIRFSTKWFDAETHLGYWGYRYYSSRLGRWMNRDPIGERGGLNLYCYVVNGPTSDVDSLGGKSDRAACATATLTVAEKLKIVAKAIAAIAVAKSCQEVYRNADTARQALNEAEGLLASCTGQIAVNIEAERQKLSDAITQALARCRVDAVPVPCPTSTRTCPDDVYKSLDRAVGLACKGPKRSCANAARLTCSELWTRFLLNAACVKARQSLVDECFGGVADEQHQREIDTAVGAGARCIAEWTSRRCWEEWFPDGFFD